MMRRLLVALLLTTAFAPAGAGADIDLAPREVAPGTYVVAGRKEDFSTTNGGAIANTAFIVTTGGVVVIDTGPTARYGEALRSAIRRITPLPVVRVFNTHAHPDHCLGNQAFAGIPVEATAATIAAQRTEGPAFLDNMYRLVGPAATGTEVHPAVREVYGGSIDIGDHRIEVLLLGGHTAGDLAVLDRTTGVLFAGDLVFHDRTPTLPHADVATWLQSLERIESLPFRVLVPGHGPVAVDGGAIRQTGDYLRWLDDRLESAASQGMDMTDLLVMPVDERFRGLAVIDAEYPRAVLQRFPAIERRHLREAAR